MTLILLSTFIIIHQHLSSKDTISNILICILEIFHEFYSSLYNISQLVANTKNSVINKFCTDLESNYSRYNRYKLLQLWKEIYYVKIIDGGLYFIISFYFILFFFSFFFFFFYFLVQLRLGFISHAVTSVTN